MDNYIEINLPALQQELKKQMDEIEDGVEMAVFCNKKGITKAILAIDVVQVRHGRWKPCGGASSICSECNVLQVLIPKFNYCPNCGAKMDLED